MLPPREPDNRAQSREIALDALAPLLRALPKGTAHIAMMTLFRRPDEANLHFSAPSALARLNGELPAAAP